MLVWKAIAAGSALVALTTVLVVSCLDRDGAHRSRGAEGLEEPPIATTEVTSADEKAGPRPPATATPGAQAPAGASASASGEGIDADAGARTGVLAPPDASASLAELIDLMKQREALEADAAAQTAAQEAADAGAPGEAAPAPAAADAGAPTLQEAWRQYNRPPMEIGAGSFTTEPPPWAASSWTPNPQAGAGPFQTESTAPPTIIFFGNPPPEQQEPPSR